MDLGGSILIGISAGATTDLPGLPAAPSALGLPGWTGGTVETGLQGGSGADTPTDISCSGTLVGGSAVVSVGRYGEDS